MKKIVFLMMSLLLTVTVYADNLQGEWKFNANNAPWGYDQGTVEFKEVEKQPFAKIAFANDTIEVKVQKKDSTTYRCNLFVDGSNVYVTLISKDNKLEGSAEADGMLIDVEFTAIKKEEKKK